MQNLDERPHLGLVTAPAAITNDADVASRVRIAAWCILPVLGLIEAVFSRHTMQDDGVSYLDMGDAIVRGDRRMAFNGIWSPLYPSLQGVAHRLLKPSAYWQFTVAHFVNFLIFLFALGSFDFLLRGAVGHSWRDNSWGRASPLPKWAVFGIGYAVFLWSSLNIIEMRLVGPDLLLSGFLYLAAGLLLRIRERPRSFWLFVLLGIALGLGYLAKAPAFPLAWLFLAISWVLAGTWRTTTTRVVIGILTFVAVSAPWIVGLSQAKGRFTVGDSARFNYVFHVNGANPPVYFQDLGTAGGHLVHPVRKLFDAPPIYEFATPLEGTSPVWYDPSYWTEGEVPRFHLKTELSTIHHWLSFYIDEFFASQAALFVGFVVLAFMAGKDIFLRQLKACWPLCVVGLAGLGMYALVYVELRYVAVFFTLIWVGIFSSIEMPPGRYGRRLVTLVTVAVVIATASPTAISAASHLLQIKGQPHNHWQVAEDLRTLGVKPGDRVARFPAHFGLAWARLLNLTVVAQTPANNSMDFWYEKPEVQSQVIEALRRLGATAIVAEQVPADQGHKPGPEWHKLGDGRYYALRLEPDGLRKIAHAR